MIGSRSTFGLRSGNVEFAGGPSFCTPQPKANAIAERFVRTVRSECLDWLLILNRRQLEHVLRVFVDHYNSHRPQRSLDLAPPEPSHANLRALRPPTASLDRRDRLGGLIHEYSLAA